MDLAAVLVDLFPISSARFSLEFVPVLDDGSPGLRRDGAGSLVATVRKVFAQDEHEDEPVAYAQDVELVYPPNLDDPRLPAYLTGWAGALRSLLARLDMLEMVGALPEPPGIAPAELAHPDVLYLRHLVTPAAFEHVLLFGIWRLGRHLPDSLDVAGAFARQLPVRVGHTTLELVPETVHEDTGEILGGFHECPGVGLAATLRLIVGDDDDEGRAPEVRETTVFVADSEHAYDPRLPEYFAGWAAALRVVFERHAGRGAGVEPEALVCREVLALRRPQTAAQFAAALLAGKRLGRLLP